MKDDRLQIMLDRLNDRLVNEQLEYFNQQISENEEFREEWYDLLAERYFDQQLDAIWVDRLEALRQNDLEFQACYNLQMQMREQITVLENQKLRKDVKEMIPQIPKSNHRRIIFLFVAAILVVILILIFNRFVTPREDVQQLYAQYYQPYEMLLTSRGDAEEQIALQEAIAAYQRQDYEKASRHFSAIQSGDLALIKLYKGICALERHQHDIAITLFSELQQDDRIRQQADWYLSLTYLKMENKEMAKILLTKMADSDHYFSKDATALLRQLDKL
jgi:hypothetical protein